MTYYKFQDSEKHVRIGKIICLARTYAEHAREMNATVTEDPLLFLKPTSSVIYDHGTIIIPKRSQCLHHEVELGVILGKKGKNILLKKKQCTMCLGILSLLTSPLVTSNLSAKKNGWPWAIAKGFDTFAPLSDAVTKEKVPDPQNLDLMLKINGTVKQSANTNQMIYSIERIISFISEIMTLEPGDLILTGTPEGVGEIKEGDVLEAQLDSIC